MISFTTLMRRLADGYADDSFSNRMRSRRFEQFEALTVQMPRPLRILDIGGTAAFWEQRGWAGRDDVEIVLVNLEEIPTTHSNIRSMVADATNLEEIADGSFDIAFSNSVIEHLFTFEAQQAMASEVRRVAPAYWVQTPNFWFPMEPHFLVPAWHWLPQRVRVEIVRRREVGWCGRCPDIEDARRVVSEVKLMRRGQVKALFPHATVTRERFCGLTKSFIARDGFQRAGRSAPRGTTKRDTESLEPRLSTKV